jgi:hypothetical protein
MASLLCCFDVHQVSAELRKNRALIIEKQELQQRMGTPSYLHMQELEKKVDVFEKKVSDQRFV